MLGGNQGHGLLWASDSSESMETVSFPLFTHCSQMGMAGLPPEVNFSESARPQSNIELAFTSCLAKLCMR